MLGRRYKGSSEKIDEAGKEILPVKPNRANVGHLPSSLYLILSSHHSIILILIVPFVIVCCRACRIWIICFSLENQFLQTSLPPFHCRMDQGSKFTRFPDLLLRHEKLAVAAKCSSIYSMSLHNISSTLWWVLWTSAKIPMASTASCWSALCRWISTKPGTVQSRVKK